MIIELFIVFLAVFLGDLISRTFNYLANRRLSEYEKIRFKELNSKRWEDLTEKEQKELTKIRSKILPMRLLDMLSSLSIFTLMKSYIRQYVSVILFVFMYTIFKLIAHRINEVIIEYLSNFPHLYLF